MKTLRAGLPDVYRPVFPSFFDRPAPEEKKATCSNCAMCESNAAPSVAPLDGENRFYRPDTKCCTYHPRLPNFLVGAILSDESPEMAEGRARIRAKIDKRIGTGPQWIKSSPLYEFLYDNARKAFGRAASLRCPYYGEADGSCTIWRYREAVCSTFFCKYMAGNDGRKFWMSLKSYLALAEIQLSRWALLELAPEYILAGKDKLDGTRKPLSAGELDDASPSEHEYRTLWGAHVGREEELYRKSYELVRTLTPAAYDRIVGLDADIYLRVVEDAWGKAMRPQLPVKLKLNSAATVAWLPDGSVALGAYSENEALALPGEAYSLLTAFTGRETVAATRERLQNERSSDLGDELLLELWHHRVLIEA